MRSLIPHYLKTVEEQDWEELSKIPHELPAWKLITKVQGINLNWNPATPSEELLKSYVFKNLNKMDENRNRRIIEWRSSNLPTVFWVISFSSYIVTLLSYLSVGLRKHRLLLVYAYAIMVGMMFYGIAVLDKPFLSRVIKPVSFEMMYNDISGGARASLSLEN